MRTPPRFLLGLLLIVLTASAYLPVLENGFVDFDDLGYVAENPHLRGGFSADTLAWAWTTFRAGNWHPLTWMAHLLDVRLYGLSPAGHHLSSLVLHLGSTALLLLTLTAATGSFWPSLLASALFALHPLHVESVAWVAERKDVLAGFVFMLTVLGYLHYLRRPSPTRLAAVWGLHALALTAKPMAVTAPFILLLLDWWPLGRLAVPWKPTVSGRSLGGLLAEKAPLFGLSAASSVITVIAQHRGGGVQPLALLSLGDRLAHALTAYLWYIGKALLPVRLAVYYPLPFAPPPAWAVIGSLVVLSGASILAVAVARRWPFAATGWFWYLGMLVPVIGIVQVGGQHTADRYSYLPLTGLSIALSWAMARFPPRPRTVAAGVMAAAVLVLGAATRFQTLCWRDSSSLLTRAIAVTKDNWMAWNCLGTVYLKQKRLPEALEASWRTVSIAPAYPGGYHNLGLSLSGLGRDREAVDVYRRGLARKPDSAELHNNLGAAEERAGNLSEAEKHFRLAIRNQPELASPYFNLGQVLMKRGRPGESEKVLIEGLGLEPGNAPAHNQLGALQVQAGNLPEAEKHFRLAIRHQPEFKDAYFNLGSILMNSGRDEEAQTMLAQGLALDPGNAPGHNNLAVIFYQRGDLAGARLHLEEALRLRPDYEQARRNLEAVRNGLQDGTQPVSTH